MYVSLIYRHKTLHFNLHPSVYFWKCSDWREILWMWDLNARCGIKSDILHDRDRYNRFIHTQSDENPRYFRLNAWNSMDTVTNASGNRLIDLCLSFKFPPTYCQWSNWWVWPIYKHYYKRQELDWLCTCVSRFIPRYKYIQITWYVFVFY